MEKRKEGKPGEARAALRRSVRDNGSATATITTTSIMLGLLVCFSGTILLPSLPLGRFCNTSLHYCGIIVCSPTKRDVPFNF